MSYVVAVENFEGPFDLLLQLVEAEELDITDISLTQVTEPFLRYVEERGGDLEPEELADFLVIAAKLVYLKSQAIVPGLRDEDSEDSPDLASQLRSYQALVAAAKHLQRLAASGPRSFGCPAQLREREPGMISALTLTSQDLQAHWQQLIRRLEPLTILAKTAIERVATLEEKMAELTARIKKHMRVSFQELTRGVSGRAELIITFLALLELSKQRTCTVDQPSLFQDISITTP